MTPQTRDEDASEVDLGIPGVEEAVEVGHGGFATVYRAQQPAFRRTVAVKVLDRRLDPTSLGRFQREQEAMGALGHHPAIVTVLDGGVTPSGRPYLLMPFFDRGSLQDVLDRGHPLPWQDVLTIGIRLAGALAAAHQEGVLHRDVKPANVLLSRYGEALLADFGIARIVGGPETTTGTVSASIAHAPPEVLDGTRPSVASDVYSLGSTLYALLAGRPAFHAHTDESILPMISRILTQPPPGLEGDIPAALSATLEQAMAKRPEDRFDSAMAFGESLRAVQQELGLPLTPLLADLSGGASEPAGTPASEVAGSERPEVPAFPEATVPVMEPVPPAQLPAHDDTVTGPLPPAQLPTHDDTVAVTTPPVAPGDAPGRQRRGPVAFIAVAAVAVVAVAGVLVWQLMGGDDVPPGPAAADLATSEMLDGFQVNEEILLLEPRQSVEGRIEPGTAQAYRFTAPTGYARVRLSAHDEEFDPFLIVYDENSEVLAYDDDSGGGMSGRDAVLEGAGELTGTFTAVAAGFSPETQGDYTLTYIIPEDDPIDVGGADGSIHLPDREVVAYTFEGSQDEFITLRMTSSEVDSYLEVWDPHGDRVIGDDDSGGGENGTDALIEWHLPLDGTYTVVARANGEEGSFRLELTRD